VPSLLEELVLELCKLVAEVATVLDLEVGILTVEEVGVLEEPAEVGLLEVATEVATVAEVVLEFDVGLLAEEEGMAP